MTDATPSLPETLIEDFQRDGCAVIRGVFQPWIEALKTGIEENMANPSFRERTYHPEDGSAAFFQDFCNWDRIDGYRALVRHSPMAGIAAALMQSKTARIFHDHVLVKEPGTSKPTPWHQDAPYYFVKGQQTVSFWSPVDPVTDATLRCVAGSHKWEKPVLPTRWLNEDNFYPDDDAYMPVPDPDAEGMTVREWQMQPGDAVAFNYDILHGARGNTSNTRRRAFSVRFVGDDARYVERPGPTSPPFPGHDMKPGQRLREDWFPTIFQR